jgi:hypothetical protein
MSASPTIADPAEVKAIIKSVDSEWAGAGWSARAAQLARAAGHTLTPARQ